MASRDSTELSSYAKEIVSHLSIIFRTAQIHDSGNIAVISAIDKFVTLVNSLLVDEDRLFLEMVGEYFFLNERRVKFSMEYVANFDFLANEFKTHNLGSLSFTDKIKVEDVQMLLKVFIESSFSRDPFDTLVAGLGESTSIVAGKVRVVKEEEGEVDARKTIKKTYFSAVSFTSGVMKKISSGEKVNIKKAKRVVQSLADVLLSEEELLLGMTAIKDYDDYTYHHSVNVSILSIALGQRLGFPKKTLLDLGLAALFHDIGKLDIPPEILNKPTPFTPEEWKIVRRHPFWGVKSILEIKGLDSSAITAAIVAFEHHIHQDHTGYPHRKRINDLDLYSRIVGIVDQYDGMTSARVYARTPLSPDRAFKLMLERSGKQLDPLLLKFFINMVGVYPVGTLVMLNTRELGLVYSSTAAPTRPNVLVIMNDTGERIDGSLVDLNEKATDGHYLRRVLKTMDPNKYKINLAEYLL